MRRVRDFDWEAIAGIAAAVTALVLHLLHVVEEGVLLAVILVLLALLLLRDLRRESRDEAEGESLSGLAAAVGRLQASVSPPDTILLGPRELRAASERFARQAEGDMVWFNVCLLMFVPQELFNVLLRPAIENPRVTSIHFVLAPSERSRWEEQVVPKARACSGFEKLQEPRWVDLSESISFILADTPGGATEAHVSFWGEPFMSRQQGQDIPRYVLHVQPHSELIPRLVELDRTYRLRANPVDR